jgi:hypothetical protein
VRIFDEGFRVVLVLLSLWTSEGARFDMLLHDAWGSNKLENLSQQPARVRFAVISFLRGSLQVSNPFLSFYQICFCREQTNSNLKMNQIKDPIFFFAIYDIHYENENAKIVVNPKFPFFGAKSVLIGNP